MEKPISHLPEEKMPVHKRYEKMTEEQKRVSNQKYRMKTRPEKLSIKNVKLNYSNALKSVDYATEVGDIVARIKAEARIVKYKKQAASLGVVTLQEHKVQPQEHKTKEVVAMEEFGVEHLKAVEDAIKLIPPIERVVAHLPPPPPPIEDGGVTSPKDT